MELGRLRREVTAVEPIGEPRKQLLHELAQREVCGLMVVRRGCGRGNMRGSMDSSTRSRRTIRLSFLEGNTEE